MPFIEKSVIIIKWYTRIGRILPFSAYNGKQDKNRSDFMNKKNNAKKIAALLLSAALAVGSVGCSGFIVKDNEKDLAQTVAKVDISSALTEEYTDVKGDVGEIVKSLSTEISKRELMAYFLSTGYQYVESYGYSYEDTFNMLMDGLVSRKLMMQYAIAYYLKNTDLNAAGCKAYVEQQKAAATEKEKALLEEYPEVLTLKYFLTDGGKDDTEYKKTVYNVKKSINDALDELETTYIKAETEEHDHGEVRTLPTGVKTEKEDYFNENYGIYTGRNTKDGVGGYGDYKKQDGSTTSTRQKAYNAFLANLQAYSLISSGKAEDTSDVTHLNYYYVELSSMLGQALIEKYFDTLETEVTAQLDGAYMQRKYDEIYASQKAAYENDPIAYAEAMGKVSDTSFLLYGLNGFGYVYNILLPFSTSQNIHYGEAKKQAVTQDELYTIRKNILAGVEGKDLRDSWISVHEDDNHSYVKDGKYYFFEENDKYEKLSQYVGSYPYQGKVEKEDDEFKTTPDKISIGNANEGFIKVFEEHITNTVNVSGIKAEGKLNEGNTQKFSNPTENYANYNLSDGKYTDAKGEVKDYSSFIYYTGKVKGLETSAKDYFVEDSNAYKAISAVNELMFAYSTDTGCLNTYFGYAVSPYKTDFVKEFEYAAREAVKGGAGSYVVCATDYGWHIIYASYVYTAADVYGGYKTEDVDKEGTFSNLFYESLKSSAAENYTTEKQNEVLNRYNNDKSVTLYKSRYKDLLEMN